LHWPYPDWFYEGPEAHRNPHREEQNPYQNPEALVETHRRLARELARHPNIIAWEAPTNEPAISSVERWKREGNDPTIADIPLLMREWNQWLRKTYGTREALDAAWRATDQQPDANGLHEKEMWNGDGILPPGHFGVPAAQCMRVYDYMSWAIEYHTMLTGQIAEAVREGIPDLVVQQQPLAGGARWERDPVPVSFGVWQQSHADGVQVGGHYGVGHSCAYLSPLDMPSMNSEEEATGRQGIYARHRAHNQGACPFVYFPIKHGFCDWRGNLRESASWLTSVADFWDSAHCVREARVLVVVNSRTEAIGGAPSGAGVQRLLERMDVEYDMAASQYVAAHPEMVGRYLCATMTLSYGDFECLRVLGEADIPVFLFGSLGPDVRGRRGAGDLADQCAAAGVLVKRRPDNWGETGTPGNRVSLTQLYGPGSLGVSFDVPVHGGMTHLAESDLADRAVVLATHDVDQSPALVVQDKLLWWLGGDTLQAGPEQSERLLADFLVRGGVARVWPPTPQSIHLQTYWYVTGQAVVYSEASETLEAKLKTRMILLDMEGNPVSQRVGRDGSSTVPVPVPWASNARFFKLLPVQVVPKGEYEDIRAVHAVQLVGENKFSMELAGEGCRIEILAPGNAGAKAIVLLDGKSHPSRFVRFRKHVMNIPAGSHSLTIRVPAGPGKPRRP
ncbi:MAG: hypothetical protein KAI66_14885, partial [Lentisphaeria bacterium]|nr:hypothetical protein [Lentisphaeria bacterium]